MILTILGAILAIWLVFMAIGWIIAMPKTFVIIGLIARRLHRCVAAAKALPPGLAAVNTQCWHPAPLPGA
jgi:hypothetical protein